jgi:hypothetical protein
MSGDKATIDNRVTLADGRELIAEVRNPDMIAWDFETKAKKWGGAQESPILWLTFVSWHALCRAGEYPKFESDGKTSTFKKFREEDCLTVDEIDDGNDDAGDPTPPAHGPDSASS